MKNNIYWLLTACTAIFNAHASEIGYVADEYYKKPYQYEQIKLYSQITRSSRQDHIDNVKNHLSKINTDTRSRSHISHKEEFKNYVATFLCTEQYAITENSVYSPKKDYSLSLAISLAIRYSTYENFISFYNAVKEIERGRNSCQELPDMNNLIQDAAQCGRMEMMTLLLKDYKYLSPYNINSALKSAAGGNQVEVIEHLLTNYMHLLKSVPDQKSYMSYAPTAPITNIVYNMLEMQIESAGSAGLVCYLDENKFNLPLPSSEQIETLFEKAFYSDELLIAMINSRHFRVSQSKIDQVYIDICSTQRIQNYQKKSLIENMHPYASSDAQQKGTTISNDINEKEHIANTISNLLYTNNGATVVNPLSPLMPVEHLELAPAAISLSRFITDLFTDIDMYDTQLSDGTTQRWNVVSGISQLGAALQGIDSNHYSENLATPYKVDIDNVNHSITATYLIVTHKRMGTYANESTDIKRSEIKLKRQTQDLPVLG